MMQATMTKTLLVNCTAPQALALYDAAVLGAGCFEEAAHNLAAVLRQPKAAPKIKGDAFTVAFAAALKRSCEVVEARCTTPILGCVRLAAGGGTITLTGTDLDIESLIEVRGYDGPTFAAAVGAHALQKLVKGAKVVRFHGLDEAGRLKVEADGAQACLPGFELGDFPAMGFTARQAATLGGEDLAKMLAFVAPYISAEETRYYLNGVYVHAVVEDGRAKLRTVATDGSRLALDAIETPWSLPAAIWPRKMVGVALGALGPGVVTVQAGHAVELAKDGSKIGDVPLLRLTFPDGARLTSKLIDGNFPDYSRVIPQHDQATRIAVDNPREMVEALKRLAALSAERSRSVRLSFFDHRVSGLVRTLDGAVTTAELPCFTDGRAKRPDASFNAVTLAALLSGPGELQVGAPTDAALMTYAGHPERLALLMPLRT